MSTTTNRANRASLRRLEEQQDEIQDTRSNQLRTIAVLQDPAVVGALEAIFEGTGVMADERKAQLLIKIRNEVHTEWSRARHSFLAIGKSLLIAEETLTPDEFRRLKQGSERIFPFSETIASQLRQVARAVMSGRFKEDEMPGSYSVAYQIAVMDLPTIEIARSRNLVRPDVTRTEVIAFRREIIDRPNTQPQRMNLTEVRREKSRLMHLRAKLAKKLESIEARLMELAVIET